MADMEKMAADPHTAPEALAKLAHEHPELQPLIADNPAIYVDLLQWIAEHGTDEGKAAANARLAKSAPEVPPTPTGNKGWLVAASIFFGVIIIAIVVWILVVSPWGSDDDSAATSMPQSSAQSSNEPVDATALDAAIAAGEDAVTRAQEELNVAQEKAGDNPDLGTTQMFVETQEAMRGVNTAIAQARDLKGEVAQGDPTDQLVAQIEASAQSISEATTKLERVTQEMTKAVQAAPQASTCEAPVPGAYSCAGGPIPENASEIWVGSNEYQPRVGVVETPSGNIKCYADPTRVDCIVREADPGAYPEMEHGGVAGALMEGSGPVTATRYGGVPHAFTSDPVGTVLGYGDVGYFDDYAFASSEEGLTLWNASSGNGALINRSGLHTFAR